MSGPTLMELIEIEWEEIQELRKLLKWQKGKNLRYKTREKLSRLLAMHIKNLAKLLEMAGMAEGEEDLDAIIQALSGESKTRRTVKRVKRIVKRLIKAG